MVLKLYNSLTKKLEEFKPLKKGKVSMYTCGPTVYNYAHIGNFFAYLSADTLYRWLKHGEGYNVKWIMNITDIDDKTIRDSLKKHPNKEPKNALKEFTEYYEQVFKRDLETLNITGVSNFPQATKYIQEQQDLVKKIYENAYAYIGDGSVYFSISKYKKDHKYGKLVHIDDGFKDGARVDSDEYEKESAADFVLWKGRKDGEPFWEFEIDGQKLDGRPGWHLECSAMENSLLDLPFDIHTGGMDLKFPHHEDEIAQSCAGYGIEPTKYWIHNGYLQVEGEKMSKSKGNFFTLSDLTEKKEIPADVIRLLIVTGHYRKNFNFTENGIHTMKKNLEEIRNTYSLAKEINISSNITSNDKETDEFKKAMKDDLNTPLAFSIFLKIIKDLRNKVSHGETVDSKSILNFIEFSSNIFGVDFSPKEINIPKEIIDLAEKRKKVRLEKNFKESDKLRDEIQVKGFIIKDNKDGYTLSKK